jgi:hypothetical protein
MTAKQLKALPRPFYVELHKETLPLLEKVAKALKRDYPTAIHLGLMLLSCTQTDTPAPHIMTPDPIRGGAITPVGKSKLIQNSLKKRTVK